VNNERYVVRAMLTDVHKMTDVEQMIHTELIALGHPGISISSWDVVKCTCTLTFFNVTPVHETSITEILIENNIKYNLIH